MPVNLVTIHHEGAGSPSDDPRGAPGGYTYWIGSTRWERLRAPADSYATLNFNGVSLDICLSGDRMTWPVSNADIALVHGAFMDCFSRGEVTASAMIRAHRNSPGSNTVCPGDNTMARWQDAVNACRPEEDMQLSTVTNKDGRMEVFMLENGVISHRWRDLSGKWSASVPFPGVGWGAMSAGENQDGRLELFASDGSGVESHCWQQVPGANWTGWVVL